MRTRIRDGVVVLNASFEPLGVVPLARALVFLMRERAVIVDADPDRTVRSASAEYPFPRVLQFREMVRVPYRWGSAPFSRKAVLERDDYECCYCDRRRATTIDHVLPRSRGGEDAYLACVSACAPCNGKKGAQTPEEAGMPMRYQPREVTLRETLVMAIARAGADPVALGLS